MRASDSLLGCARRRETEPLVLGLARGGVVVATPVAHALLAPLDVIVARKIGAPDQPEFAIGAVAPGVTLLRRDVIRSLGLAEGEVETAAALETAHLDEVARRYRGERAAERVTGRDAIVVDDGLATGATATAALRAVRLEHPRRLVLAVPICDADSARQLASECDEFVCVQETHELVAVGLWYETFREVSDDEVRELLGVAASPEVSAWQKM